MNMFGKKILALSPHTDDIELGCGGTLTRFKESGAKIHVINFSRSKNHAADTGDEVAEEFKHSMEVLGASFEMLNMPTRRLPEHRQEILDYLHDLNKQEEWDTVFCHSSFDEHQDHQTVQKEAFRAFKTKTILGYELPWNCRQFKTDFFIKLENRHVENKIKMLSCYKSQMHRAFVNKEYVRDIARTRGLQVQSEYAECFELIRGVI